MGDASGGGGAKADMRCLGAGKKERAREKGRGREREFAQFFGAYSERGAGMRCAQYFRVSGDAGERERERERRSGGFGRERNS